MTVEDMIIVTLETDDTVFKKNPLLITLTMEQKRY